MEMGRIWFCMGLCIIVALGASHDVCGDTLTSSVFVLETRTSVGGRVLRGSGRMSPVADAAHGQASLSVDGALADGWSPSSPTFDSTVLADGWHDFSLNEDGNLAEARLLALNDAGVVVHGGTLTSDETWEADKIHVVKHWVRIPAGLELAIASGAVVKFCDGTGIQNEGTLTASGALFTHIADDSEEAGGDTNMDGHATVPVHDAYELTGIAPATDCELRYLTQTVAGGTISGTTILGGNRVHKVTGAMTVASGGKLVVEPGAIVKMGADMSITVNEGGTLEALGTLSRHIVFTSVKDDAHGGDTNGDEDGSEPQPGDWQRITVGGTVRMRYVTIAYLNGGSECGAIQGDGGSVTFDNGVIEKSGNECVRMDSGRFTATNSVFRDAATGIGCDGGAEISLVNCIITDVTAGSRSGNAHFTNCIFYRVMAFTEQDGASGAFTHCVFYNPAGYGEQSWGNCGSNGNSWADPLFSDASNGDYALQALSPCIDAGDGAAAPSADYWGNPRSDVEAVANSGVAMADGTYPDIGIHEMAGRHAGACADLSVELVTGPGEAKLGEWVTVSWTVSNKGTEAVEVPWSDVVFLKGVDEGLGGQVVVLGEITADGTLEPEAKRTITWRFRLPPLKTGTWQFGVTVNSERDVYELIRTNNQALSESSLSLTVPAGYIRLELKPGWNLISLPFVPVDFNVKQLLERVPYGVSGSAYVQAMSLEAGKGYWLYHRGTAATHIELVSDSGDWTAQPMELEDGWNMVGPTASDYTLDDSHTVWFFENGKWQRLDTGEDGQYQLKAGQGYWIYHHQQDLEKTVE